MAPLAGTPPRFGLRRLIGATLIRAGLVLLLVPAVFAMRSVANLHRRWSEWVLGRPITRPYLSALPALSATNREWRTRILALVRDPATRRDLGWLGLELTLGLTLCASAILLLVLGLAAVGLAAAWLWLPTLAKGARSPLIHLDQIATQLGVSSSAVLALVGLIVLLGWRLAAPTLLRADARLARWLLAPTEQSRLAIRVRELAESRAQTVDSQATELRRIERDLHDGAQARLVALGMSLGLAEELIEQDPTAARVLLAEARATSGQALSELRALVRGIHPPVLADRGLEGAVQAFAMGLPIPVHIEAEVSGRLSPQVESAAYFVVAETLTNVVKHAAASTATVRLRHADQCLTIAVQDNGVGGADPECGTGLRGVQRRLAAFDGTVKLTSPAGGPTLVRMELPCELSSPKTSPSSAMA